MNDELQNRLKELSYLRSISSLLNWDSSTQMPKNGGKNRANAAAYLSGLLRQKSTDERFISLIKDLDQKKDKTDIENAVVYRVKLNYEFLERIPEDFYIEFRKNVSMAELAWEDARDKNDYSIFLPYLKKIISDNKQIAEYVGYKTSPYDVFLDRYEKGLTTTTLDPIFEKLKKECGDITKKLSANGSVNKPELPKVRYDKSIQKEMSLDLLSTIGFSMDSGTLSEIIHPMASSLSSSDVRLSVNYNESDFTEIYLSVLHEGGHGLYEQNIEPSLYGTTLSSGTSMSIHEACSRMYENNLGRSDIFLNFYYPKIVKLFPQMQSLSFDDFYKVINKSEPSLVRIHADEVTYHMHIIIRYELERALLNDNLSVEELPHLWNEKYEKYLGVKPTNYVDGVLQDVHWSNSLIGYFPSYSLGSIYASQFFHAFKKENADWKENIEKGNIIPLTSWMKEKVFKHGSIYTALDILNRVTGEGINVDHYTSYLKEKYSK